MQLGQLKRGFIKAIIVLVPSYITAYLTGQMIYVVPMLAASGFIAAAVFYDNFERRVEEDSYKKEEGDSGSE